MTASSTPQIGIAGGRGLVGSAIHRAAIAAGAHLVELPRVPVSTPRPQESLEDAAVRTEAEHPEQIRQLERAMIELDVVINAAGHAEPGSDDDATLRATNGVLAVVLARCARRAEINRFVHISSAAVQGGAERLDETNVLAPFSAYSRSKAEAEESLLNLGSLAPTSVVLYRPTSVQHPGRDTTKRLIAFLDRRFVPVFGDGNAPLPLALLDNVGALAFHLAMTSTAPTVVLHPWEGVTQQSLVQSVGSPRTRLVRFPRFLGGALSALLGPLERIAPRRAGSLRRAELLTRGQRVEANGAAGSGFAISADPSAYATLRPADTSDSAPLPAHLNTQHETMLQTRSRRRSAMRLAQRAGVVKLAAALDRRRLGPHIRVINYHDITPEFVDQFESHVSYYAERYSPVDFDLLGRFLSGEPTDLSSDRPGLIVTFDDGFASHASIAAPVLERHGFPGWFFIATDAQDVPPAEQERWAKDHGVIAEATSFDSRRVFASWDEIANMSSFHIVGSHTAAHRRFGSDISLDDAAAELNRSRACLEEKLARPCSTFCWVGGEVEAYSTDAAQAVADAGFDFAFRTSSSPVQIDTDPLAIERTNIEADYSLGEVEFQLSGLTDMRYGPKRRRIAQRLEEAAHG